VTWIAGARPLAEVHNAARMLLTLDVHSVAALTELRQSLTGGEAEKGEVRARLCIGEPREPVVQLGRHFALDGELAERLAQIEGLANVALTTQRPIEGGGLTDCTGEGAMRNIFAVTARRYPIVDEEAGAVLGLALFQRFPGVDMRRNLLAEWFYIEQGKIRSIYAAMYYPAPEAMVPNWPPFDGNWPATPAAK
jgi:hypothetical protein